MSWLDLLSEPAPGERLRRHCVKRADHWRRLRERTERESFAIQLALERGDDRRAHADARELVLGGFEPDATGDATRDTREATDKLLELLVVGEAQRERRPRVVARRRALGGDCVDSVDRTSRGVN